MAERPDLWQLESDLHAQGYGTLCGVDEAGAGPLAGRVYAAAVILPQGWDHPVPQRLQTGDAPAGGMLLYEAIDPGGSGLVRGLGRGRRRSTPSTSSSARMLAMERAIQGLSSPHPDLALIDGNRSHGITAAILLEHQTVVKGDSLRAPPSPLPPSWPRCAGTGTWMEMDRHATPSMALPSTRGTPPSSITSGCASTAPVPSTGKTFLKKL